MIRTPGADRIQTPHERREDEVDASLRPRALDEFVGQEAVKDQLGVSIAAAAARGEALDHVLLAGPPGLGKTSLAQIVAAELDVPFIQTAGPALERKGDIASFLTALEPRAVFFVDEIHRLPRAVEETFYPAMEDRQLPITVGAGSGGAGRHARPAGLHADRRHHPRRPADHAAARPLRHPAPARPLRRRRPGARSPSARRGCSACRSTPAARGRSPSAPAAPRASPTGSCGGCATSPRSTAAARSTRRWPARRSTCSRSTTQGLDRLDREILSTICEQFSGGPVGLSTLAVAVQEESDTIEDVYEPYLLQRGFIKRTPRGRCATVHAFRHLGLEPPAEDSTLF